MENGFEELLTQPQLVMMTRCTVAGAHCAPPLQRGGARICFGTVLVAALYGYAVCCGCQMRCGADVAWSAWHAADPLLHACAGSALEQRGCRGSRWQALERGGCRR